MNDWKEIAGYEGKYFVNSIGQVKSMVGQKAGC